ncbi:hypothetical protein OGAPHI_004609 [Ogataea philodendri]|uniref:Uncharacterized protein n=1 Tax=Ogataea philodendri TaxID=1378263 RepID=A0A9P8P3N2_9ASCO|nr:uncharacterized protein OGAPHI_004609 [Ogataea philodendri]KAH3664257.1 hypothetical protein OGAPHI_004609 [Ogataea philodendri]
MNLSKRVCLRVLADGAGELSNGGDVKLIASSSKMALSEAASLSMSKISLGSFSFGSHLILLINVSLSGNTDWSPLASFFRSNIELECFCKWSGLAVSCGDVWEPGVRSSNETASPLPKELPIPLVECL